jgi:hypothetical protein
MPTLKEIATRLARQPKSLHVTQSRVAIPRRHFFPVRNLLYHVYAAKSNDLWRANVRQLIRRWGLFTGRRIVAIATGPKTHDPEVVAREFRGLPIEFWEVPNDPQLREVATLRPLLQAIASTDEDEVTFYGHTKGNTTEESTDHNMPDADRLRGATRWRNAMYHHLLDRWPRVEAALKTSAAVGTTQMAGRFTYPSGLRFGPGFWMFAGTFFWIRHDVIFGLPNWSTIHADRYGAEAWLGSLLPLSAVASVYQPWPPAKWPNRSPYNPALYGKEFDDHDA